MTIAILADDQQKEELLSKEISEQAHLVWADSLRSLGIIDADAYFDLLFEFDFERIAQLRRLLPRPVIVNSVTHTIGDMRQPLIRINAWPTMLKRDVTELSSAPEMEAEIKNIFSALGWKCQLVPDITGMVTPRIVSTIINEAWFTFGDGISTKEEIDTAMKLGTNYPFGPFEWGQKIGIARVKDLLLKLTSTDPRYTIAPALIKEQ